MHPCNHLKPSVLHHQASAFCLTTTHLRLHACADHWVPVHLFQNDTMLCRPAGRIARALQGCCWAELGLEVKVI